MAAKGVGLTAPLEAVRRAFHLSGFGGAAVLAGIDAGVKQLARAQKHKKTRVLCGFSRSPRIFSDVIGSSKWWSRGESNPRPQVLRYKIYVRSRVYCSHRSLPDGQGKQAASPVIFR